MDIRVKGKIIQQISSQRCHWCWGRRWPPWRLASAGPGLPSAAWLYSSTRHPHWTTWHEHLRNQSTNPITFQSFIASLYRCSDTTVRKPRKLQVKATRLPLPLWRTLFRGMGLSVVGWPCAMVRNSAHWKASKGSQGMALSPTFSLVLCAISSSTKGRRAARPTLPTTGSDGFVPSASTARLEWGSSVSWYCWLAWECRAEPLRSR